MMKTIFIDEVLTYMDMDHLKMKLDTMTKNNDINYQPTDILCTGLYLLIMSINQPSDIFYYPYTYTNYIVNTYNIMILKGEHVDSDMAAFINNLNFLCNTLTIGSSPYKLEFLDIVMCSNFIKLRRMKRLS